MKKMKRRSNSQDGGPKYPRTARVNELLREIIAQELERFADKDDRLHLVTVTGVETDPDLRHARVFYSALAATASQEDVIAGLAAHRVQLQSAIGKNVRMKRTPQLEFKPDRGIEEGQRVEEILRNLNTDD